MIWFYFYHSLHINCQKILNKDENANVVNIIDLIHKMSLHTWCIQQEAMLVLNEFLWEARSRWSLKYPDPDSCKNNHKGMYFLSMYMYFIALARYGLPTMTLAPVWQLLSCYITKVLSDGIWHFISQLFRWISEKMTARTTPPWMKLYRWPSEKNTHS